jgi:maltose/moltooligosaccharide transporter
MLATKPKKSFLNIFNMNLGFFGIQFSFGLQQSNMSALYTYLGADPEKLAVLWLAGPVTGLIVQPIIGAISDGTWSPRWGRRKPYFLVGALIASMALVLMPHSQTLWMAAGLLWILDAANNIAMEPYRAFITDLLPEKQHSLGFLMQSFFTGLGTTIANFAPAIIISLGLLTMEEKMENGIPIFTYWAFAIGAFVSIATVLFTVLTTKEYAPTEEELKVLNAEKKKNSILKRTVSDIQTAILQMPKAMIQLIPVQFFTWYAMFCYWQYITLALSSSLYNTVDGKSALFAKAQILTGSINGWYNIICFSIAFLLVPLAKKIGSKRVHFFCLLLGGIGLLAFPYLRDDVYVFSISNPFTGNLWHFPSLYLLSIGLGFSWASMLAMPYKLLSASIPQSKSGVYMGIFNLFIVIPMIIQIFSVQYFLYDFLNHNPVNIILIAGGFLVMGGIFSLFISMPKENSNA